MNSVRNSDCLYPQTMDELVALAEKHGDAEFISGGTDLYPQWKSGHRKVPGLLISLTAVPELRSIDVSEDVISIGAAVTHEELNRSKDIQEFLPLIAEAAGTVGARQIQVRGTIGGSVANASPAGDLAPPIMAYDGQVVLCSASGERRLSLPDFFKGYKSLDMKPGEFIRSFVFNIPKNEGKAVFRKLGIRKAQAISKVMCAMRYSTDGSVVSSCRLAFGSVGPVPLRLVAFEKWIEGKDLNTVSSEEVEKMVSAEITPIDDIRSTGEYRQWVSGRIVSNILFAKK